MNSGRKRFNKKMIAFVLALSMLFSQSAIVFATEGQNPVSENETVEAPAGLPGAEELTAPDQETPAEEPAEEEEPASEEAPEAEAQTPAEAQAEEPAEAAEPEVAVKEENEEPDEEPAGASENKTTDKTISLSGGSITISINSISENLVYAKGVTVSESSISKNAYDPAGFDFSVVSGGSAVLAKGIDYNVKWLFTPKGMSEVYELDEDDFLPEAGGTLVARIEGISKSETVSSDTVITGYSNWISIKVNVKEYVKPSLSENEVIVSPSYNRVEVTNSSNSAFYVELLSQTLLSGNGWVEGNVIEKGKTKVFYTYYDEAGKKQAISPSLNLAVVADRYDAFSVSEAQVTKKFTTTQDTGDQEPNPKDGSEINMKAVVNKSSQTIKISWKPDTNLNYKYFELQRLEADGETFKTLEKWGSKEDRKLNKKSYTYGKTEIEKAEQPAVFKLICYDADKSNPVSYATVAAPSLLYVEQGYAQDNMEYCFSKLAENDELYYRLELAEKNTETGSSEVGKRGFDKITPSEYSSREVFQIDGFKVSKTVSVDAVRDFFAAQDDMSLKPGTKYFCRVKSVFYYHGTKYTSAPSNVISKKAGPSKVYVFNINGLKYEKPTGNKTAKRDTEQRNMSRMNEYLTEYLDISGNSLSSNYFVHRENEGPDAKSGYVVFWVEHTDEQLKGFELLRSDTQYGTYKKLKLYKVGSGNKPAEFSGLYKWEPTDPNMKKELEDDHVDVYYLQYNNFIPETEYYYAVRGVYKKGNAPGGFGDGYGCAAELDSVQNIYAFDGVIDKINLYWRYDSCVKEYWIYKKEFTKAEQEAEKDPTEFTDLSDYKLLKKVKGKKSGTLKDNPTKKADIELWESTSGNLVGDYVKFIDKDKTKYADRKENKVEEGHTYQYVIVPKYNTKNSDPNYNLDKRSDVAAGMATLRDAKVKNFKASNYGVNRIRLTWSKLKGASEGYFIIRSSLNPKTHPSDWWEAPDVKVWTRDQSEKTSFIDNTVDVGTYYYYVIYAGSSRSGEITNGSLKKARSLPLAVTDAKVSQGSNFRNGATVTWSKNPRDEKYKVAYKIQYNDGGGNWTDLPDHVYGTSYTDNTELRRGVNRSYRVVSRYNGYDGGTRNAGSYSKPSYIEIKADRTTMMVNETITVTVYPKIKGGAAASDIRMDGVSTSNGAVTVTDTKTEGDHITYTLKAYSRGTTEVTFKAYDYDWTSGSSTQDLKKSITVTVR